MPITFTLDHQHQRINARAVGLLSLDDYLAYVRRRIEAGAVGYDQVLDLSDGKLGFEYRHIDTILRELRAASPGTVLGEVAVVAPRDEMFAVARQLCALSRYLHCNAAAFRSEDAATRWLNDRFAARAHAR